MLCVAPLYDDPVFLEKLERFLAAFAARYDGRPWLRYVDVGSIGDRGEGHAWAGSRKTLSFAVRKRHVDLHLKHFKRSPLVISDDYVHALPDPAERASLHQHLLASGISYRDDSIMVDGCFSGSADRFTVRSPEHFADAYRLTPTVLELEHYGKVRSLGNWEARPDSAAFKDRKGEGRAGVLSRCDRPSARHLHWLPRRCAGVAGRRSRADEGATQPVRLLALSRGPGASVHGGCGERHAVPRDDRQSRRRPALSPLRQFSMRSELLSTGDPLLPSVSPGSSWSLFRRSSME